MRTGARERDVDRLALLARLGRQDPRNLAFGRRRGRYRGGDGRDRDGSERDDEGVSHDYLT
jgi:hypothetical protein